MEEKLLIQLMLFYNGLAMPEDPYKSVIKVKEQDINYFFPLQAGKAKT
jgi:hypothetical protein